MVRTKFSKIAEIVGWSLLALILIVAIIYFNVIYKAPVVDKIYAVGDRCPDFTLQQYTTQGGSAGTFSSQDARGQVLVINFWYIDCGGCKAELPHFNEVQNEYADQVKIVVVHAHDINTEDDKQAMINELGYDKFQMAFLQDTKELDLFKKLGGKSSYPMTVIVDKTGVIQSVNQGAMSKEALSKEIEKYL